jgi:hypothetical protein
MIQFVHETEMDWGSSKRSSTKCQEYPSGTEFAQISANWRQLLNGEKAHRALWTGNGPLQRFAWNKGLKVETKPKRALEKILAKGVYYKSFELKQRLFTAGLKPQRCEEWVGRKDTRRAPPLGNSLH